MQLATDIPDPRNVQGLNEGQAVTRFKVHFRCVKNPERLKSLLKILRSQEHSIEIRHSMYIIQTKRPLDQNAFVSVRPQNHKQDRNDC